jgi:hypothetical protein
MRVIEALKVECKSQNKTKGIDRPTKAKRQLHSAPLENG